MPLFDRKGPPPPKRTPVYGSPEGLKGIADSAAVDTRNRLGIVLDFSPGSLKTLDEAIDRFFETGRPPMPTTVLPFGAYLGEVVIRNLGGTWRPSQSLADVAVVGIGSVAEVYPMRRMWKRFEEGAESSLEWWYQVIEKHRSRAPTPGESGHRV